MAESPQRTCVGCRTVADQCGLVRLAWDDEHQRVVADPDRRMPGRGAYLHAADSCLTAACRRRAVGRALRRPRVDHDEIFARLAAGWENQVSSR